jgi:membrane dipeptidase
VPAGTALRKTMEMAALLFRIERQAKGRFKLCRRAAEIRRCIEDGTVAAVFHIEGAEAIDPDFKALDVLHAAGLRSLGPVWSRPNQFGHGVPFRFPSSPDTEPGLTESGKELIRRCNELRIAIDLSHLNEQGFWDVVKISKAPLIATHSNVHSICASSRNLTDSQIEAIGASGGMIGLNFANGFLRPDGLWRGDTDLDVMLRHLDRMIELAGIDHVGLGSDFEGARIPATIGDVTGLPVLQQAMRDHGYDEAMMRKLCFENWLAVLERTWGG